MLRNLKIDQDRPIFRNRDIMGYLFAAEYQDISRWIVDDKGIKDWPAEILLHAVL